LTLTAVSGRGFLHLKGVVEGLLDALHIHESLNLADFKHEMLDPDRACELKLGGQRLGFLGEVAAAGLKAFGLRGATTVLEIDIAAIASRATLVPTYEPQSPYPTIARDLNLIVTEAVRWAELAATVRSAAGSALQHLEYLDTYRDPQKDGLNTKRLHFSFTLRAADRTLTGPEADTIRDAIVAACQKQHGAKLLT
jgi:phenylalanyl-tRNA synthetase beta chain